MGFPLAGDRPARSLHPFADAPDFPVSGLPLLAAASERVQRFDPAPFDPHALFAFLPETAADHHRRGRQHGDPGEIGHWIPTDVGLQQRIGDMAQGGQQQRVAIARGLAMNPAILLADEPTGNIASAQAEEIMDIFQKINEEGHTIVMITHEPDIAEHAKRVIHIRDGKIVDDSTKHKQRRANGH